ncbi:Glycosyltransferase [Melia azedarach]|uniref:Glycosyltransferase n=1 Tax=Melia azedarach TaxID=155640 RepID=A0ACC1WRX1_MELAZ|nr:Glycosyltransferase [Melia azedarach]
MEVRLPEGVESFSSATSVEMAGKVFKGISLLQQPMEQFILENRPDCLLLICTTFGLLIWLSILEYQGLCFMEDDTLVFALLIVFFVLHLTRWFNPIRGLFVLPGLPDEIQMTRLQLPDWVRVANGYTNFMNKIDESVAKSFGVLVNSFYELESSYPDYVNVLRRKTWSSGHVWLRNVNKFDNNEQNCLMLAGFSKTQLSCILVYVSCGSLSCFSSTQLLEIATALDSLNYPFVWVVQKESTSKETTCFTRRIRGKDQNFDDHKWLGTTGADIRTSSHWWISDSLWMKFGLRERSGRSDDDDLASFCRAFFQ